MAHRLSSVRPDEARRVKLTCVYLFACMGAFILARIVRSVLFLELSAYKKQLPVVYILVAVAVASVMTLYGQMERRLRRDRMNLVTLAVMLVLTLWFRLGLSPARPQLYWLFYLWVEASGSLLVVQCWGFINDVFTARQAKRLYLLIGASSLLANVVFGFAVCATVDTIGTENLLFMVCGCLSLCMYVVTQLRGDLLSAREPPAGPHWRLTQTPLSSRYVRLMAALVLVTYGVSTLVDYQFQVTVGDTILDKDARSSYFGAFFGAIGVVAGFVQFGAKQSLFSFFGLLGALLVLPASMLFGALAAVWAPVGSALAMTALTRGAEQVLRHTVNDSTQEVLCLPIPAHRRSRTKRLNDGVLKPVAMGAVGLSLSLWTAVTGTFDGVRTAGIWIAGLAVLWMAAAVALKKAYLESLIKTLQHRRLDFAGTKFAMEDASTRRVLMQALTSTQATEVLHALELLPFCEAKARQPLQAQVITLLAHPTEELRLAALHYLQQNEPSRGVFSEARLRPLLEDPSPAVRAAAARITCVVWGSQARSMLTPLLSDADVQVRAATWVGLVRGSNLPNRWGDAEPFASLLADSDPRRRIQAAWIAAELGGEPMLEPLSALLRDPVLSVRRAAVEAAGRLRHPSLLPTLMAQLAEPRSSAASALALEDFGDAAFLAVAAHLADSNQSSLSRAAACRIVAKIDPQRGSRLLADSLADADWRVRGAAIDALVGVHKTTEVAALSYDALDHALRDECAHGFHWLAVMQDLQPDANTHLLSDALQHRLAHTRQRVLGLLSLKYDAVTIGLVAETLRQAPGPIRANALEVLDNVLGKEEKPWIFPLLDDVSPARALAATRELVASTSLPRAQRLAMLLDVHDPWMQAVAAHTCGAWGIAELSSNIEPLLHHNTALCREAAVAALRRLRSP